MTNEITAEEAIKWLKDIERSFPEAYFGEWRKALRMAIKALEAQTCEDCISREEAINEADNLSLETSYDNEKVEQMLRDLPPVTPKYTDEEIDKAQAVEQAYVDKMVELAVEETKRPKGHWIIIDDCELFMAKCSECGEIVDSRMINKYPYCHCGAEMSGGAE